MFYGGIIILPSFLFTSFLLVLSLSSCSPGSHSFFVYIPTSLYPQYVGACVHTQYIPRSNLAPE